MRFPPVVRKLLEGQQFAALATDSGRGPYQSLVAFAASKDGARLYFVTPRMTRKFGYLISQERVSLLLDDRTNRAEDCADARAMTAIGRARQVEAGQGPDALELYLAKFPHLRPFALAPESALIEVRVSRYILVDRFQSVVEFEV